MRLGTFRCADDLVQKTPQFWTNYVLPKLDRDFGGLYKFLNDPFPDGPNPYVQAVEANIAKIQAAKAG